jgi:aminobenzoyl-glutamate utilization protein B
MSQTTGLRVSRPESFSSSMEDLVRMGVISRTMATFLRHWTSKYLTGILEQEGFKIDRGIAGMPTAWMATWGSGKPVIALGSDIDCIPQTSQKPGVAYRDPIVEGAPGHGEGHNSGQPLNITSAIAIKRLMEREKLSGTIRLWPGVAEEQLAGKAHLVRAGYLKDVDVVIFTHVGNNLQVSWGTGTNTGLVSVEYLFKGESAHSAGAPERVFCFTGVVASAIWGR